MSELIGKKFLISGRVQGVFYRRFAKQSADALGITGWACNLQNSCVEVQAFSTEEQLIAYQNKLYQGPVTAKVKDIVSETITWELYPDFQIKE